MFGFYILSSSPSSSNSMVIYGKHSLTSLFDVFSILKGYTNQTSALSFPIQSAGWMSPTSNQLFYLQTWAPEAGGRKSSLPSRQMGPPFRELWEDRAQRRNSSGGWKSLGDAILSFITTQWSVVLGQREDMPFPTLRGRRQKGPLRDWQEGRGETSS